jgi:hypothetical protein
LTKYLWIGWMIWAAVLWMTSDHPPISKYPELTPGRRWLAVFALVMLSLSFTPAPFTDSSGRKFWRDSTPQMREYGRYAISRVKHMLDRSHHK